jgi:(p)ppGpp synthase/HD superfamily hydrolase
MATLEKAIQIAATAHEGQVDKAGAPYILHPLRVMLQGASTTEQVIGVLHDVLEDTPVTRNFLAETGFAPEILTALDCLTRHPDEHYDIYLRRVADNPLARRIKLADLEDNMDLRRLHPVTERDCQRLMKYRESWKQLRQSDT